MTSTKTLIETLAATKQGIVRAALMDTIAERTVRIQSTGALARIRSLDVTNREAFVVLLGESAAATTVSIDDLRDVDEPAAERRVLRVRVEYTVEVDLDAYEAEYGPATRSEVREQVQSSARSAFDAGAAFSTDDIARII